MAHKEDFPEKVIGKVKDLILEKLDEKAEELKEKHFPKTFKGKMKKRFRDTFK